MTRTEDFAGGVEGARAPQFSTIQSQHARNFQAMSVLDLPHALPNQNGLGAADLQRRRMGQIGSVSGRSQSTVDDQLWIRAPKDFRNDYKES